MASDIHGYIGDYKITQDKNPALFAAYGAGAALAMEWSADSDGVACDAVTIEQADGTLHELDAQEVDALPQAARREILDIAASAWTNFRWNNGMREIASVR